mmetsp:Transcript_21823/g.61336  ORF Transcript_21823/g.61336 Transcript_21823/m.61336 type:complete len:230 (-) Transcript_21823:201-890(-)
MRAGVAARAAPSASLRVAALRFPWALTWSCRSSSSKSSVTCSTATRTATGFASSESTSTARVSDRSKEGYQIRSPPLQRPTRDASPRAPSSPSSRHLPSLRSRQPQRWASRCAAQAKQSRNSTPPGASELGARALVLLLLGCPAGGGPGGPGPGPSLPSAWKGGNGATPKSAGGRCAPRAMSSASTSSPRSAASNRSHRPSGTCSSREPGSPSSPRTSLPSRASGSSSW